MLFALFIGALTIGLIINIVGGIIGGIQSTSPEDQHKINKFIQQEEADRQYRFLNERR